MGLIRGKIRIHQSGVGNKKRIHQWQYVGWENYGNDIRIERGKVITRMGLSQCGRKEKISDVSRVCDCAHWEVIKLLTRTRIKLDRPPECSACHLSVLSPK